MTDAATESAAYRERSFTSRDGLRLSLRDYPGPADGGGVPALCLPGLTRNARDFEALAPILAGKRRVLAADLRGRGKSQYARDPATYTVPTYASDVLDLLAAMGAHRVALIGTSLGGIVAMALAALRPSALAGVVLNDVGPEIDPKGLARIGTYVGQKPVLKDWEEAIARYREVNAVLYPKFSDSDWEVLARRSFDWDAQAGGLVSAYDGAIAEGFKQPGGRAPSEELWRLYGALGPIPTLLIRGALSDLLSPETVTAMRAKKPDLDFAEVPDVGHVPLLTEPEALGAIEDFLAKLDAAQR